MIRALPPRVASAPAALPAPAAHPRRVPAAAVAPVPALARRGRRARLRDWAELLRVSALFTVPGDALAGAASAGGRPNRGTALAVGASLCLYEAGMALNDWSDRDEDAIDRPHRPIPSGRIPQAAALGAAGALTAAGLGLAARAGRPALAVATALSATVWAYDLHLKHTKAGPAAMAAARGLDLLLGATATLSAAGRRAAAQGGTVAARPDPAAPGDRQAAAASGGSAAAVRPARGQGPAPAVSPQAFTARPGGASVRAAGPAAAALAAHTYAVTTVSRNETQGGSTRAPLAALAATGAVAAFAARPRGRAAPAAAVLLAVAYARTAAVPYLHAALNPSPPLTQRAVGGGIRAMIPLQAALAARSGAGVTGLAVMGLVPLARELARKVSPT